MKLLTQIPPRRDGTVTLTEAGKVYTFRANAQGALECEIPDEALVARLLLSGNFFPADEADYDHALTLTQGAEVRERASGGGDDDDLGDDLDNDDEVIAGGLPVEANTPPAPARPGRPRRAS